MLDPNEKSQFDGMVTRLRIDDPRFVRRIDRLDRRPRPQLRKAVAVFLWMMAPLCVVLGGWTGFFIAVVAAGYAARMVVKRPGEDPDADDAWWSLPRRRPGASL